jgi:hypothetical protein
MRPWKREFGGSEEGVVVVVVRGDLGDSMAFVVCFLDAREVISYTSSDIIK